MAFVGSAHALKSCAVTGEAKELMKNCAEKMNAFIFVIMCSFCANYTPHVQTLSPALVKHVIIIIIIVCWFYIYLGIQYINIHYFAKVLGRKNVMLTKATFI